jgi:hypothetical protein
MERFFKYGESADLVTAIFRLQEGADHVGLAQQLVQTHMHLLEEERLRRGMESRAAEFNEELDLAA